MIGINTACCIVLLFGLNWCSANYGCCFVVNHVGYLLANTPVIPSRFLTESSHFSPGERFSCNNKWHYAVESVLATFIISPSGKCCQQFVRGYSEWENIPHHLLDITPKVLLKNLGGRKSFVFVFLPSCQLHISQFTDQWNNSCFFFLFFSRGTCYDQLTLWNIYFRNMIIFQQPVWLFIS